MTIFAQPINNLIKSFNKLQEQAKTAVDERKASIKLLEEKKEALGKELVLASNIEEMLANLKFGK
jgi:hypothetical protein